MEEHKSTGWHYQINSGSDLAHILRTTDRLIVTRARKLPKALGTACEQLMNLTYQFHECRDRVDEIGLQEKSQNLTSCLRRFEFYLKHLHECEAWLVARTIYRYRGTKKTKITQLMIAPQSVFRVCVEGVEEKFLIYVPRSTKQAKT